MANVVWMYATDTGIPSLVYGRDLLKEISEGEKPFLLESSSRGVRIKELVFLVDTRTDELEYLCAAVHVLKGSHCYDDGETEGDGSLAG